MNCLYPWTALFREWRESEREKCVVRINHPLMWIKGKLYNNETEEEDYPGFFAFFGIPYAEAPVNSLRFQPPVPFRVPRHNFRYVYKAYDFEKAFPDFVNYEEEHYGKEDCLYLNIYIRLKPKRNRTPLPVLVFIHGGGFDQYPGDVARIQPDYIIKQNLVFVTLRYRLNVYGFLNMGTKECKGNAGLKDQVLALKWIKNNIGKFGGDSNNITITGHSAGATCVNLHMISPLSKGLFHKAIVQAGGIYCPWGFLRNQRKVRKLFSQAMHSDAISAAVELLKYKNERELIRITEKIKNNLIIMEPRKLLIFLGPTIESYDEGAFLPYNVEYLKSRAKAVPLMAGICEGEGFMYILARAKKYPDGFRPLITEDQKFVNFLMQNFRWSQETALRHKDTIRNLYFPNLDEMRDEDLFLESLANLNTDIWFRRFYDNFKMGPNPAPFYVYKFSYIAFNDRIRKLIDDETPDAPIIITAPTHGDERDYQYDPERFHCPNGKEKLLEEIPVDIKIVTNTMCSLLAKFCKMGDFESSILHLNAAWRPHTESSPCFLDIKRNLTMMQGRLNEDRWKILNEIVEAESRVASPPASVHSIIMKHKKKKIKKTSLEDYELRIIFKGTGRNVLNSK